MLTKDQLIIGSARDLLRAKNCNAILTHDYEAQVAGLVEIITEVVNDPANHGVAFRKAHLIIEQKIWIGGKWEERLDAKPLVNSQLFAR